MRLRPSRVVRSIGVLAVALCLVPIGRSPAAAASGISAKVTYTGQLGPVASRKPLCLCAFYDAELTSEAGCLISSGNGRTFQINTGDSNDYYLVAFLDLQRNEIVDAGEPYEIFQNRSLVPADAVTAMEGYNQIEIEFGDENRPEPCLGDCNHSGEVTPDEITTLVAVDLDATLISSCTTGDRDDSSTITVDEIVSAVRHLDGACPL